MSTHTQHHSTRPYFVVYTILMVLLVATVALAYVHFGAFNIPIAMLVATIKAGLVVVYFMHVKDNSPIIALTIFASLAALFVGFLMMLMDYLTR